MVTRHPLERTIYMQSLLQFFEKHGIKRKNCWKIQSLESFVPLGSSSSYPSTCCGGGEGTESLPWDWIWEGGRGFWGEKDSEDQWRLQDSWFLPFSVLLLLYLRVFSSGAHRNSFEQSDSEQHLKFFTKKSEMAWFEISDSTLCLYFKSTESWAREVLTGSLENFTSPAPLEDLLRWVLHLKDCIIILFCCNNLHVEDLIFAFLVLCDLHRVNTVVSRTHLNSLMEKAGSKHQIYVFSRSHSLWMQKWDLCLI